MHKTIPSTTIFLSNPRKTTKSSQKTEWNFNDTQTRLRSSWKKLCVLSLVYNSRTLLSAVFVWGLKFTNRQLDRKTFEVDKWVLLEISNWTVVEIETIKISMNICYCLPWKHSNQWEIWSEILNGSSVSAYYIIGGAWVITCFEA